MSDKFQIRKEPVRARDESGAKIWGWTFSEIGAVLLIFILLYKLFGLGLLTAGGIIFSAIWIKNLRMAFPERHFTNMLRFHLRTKRYYYTNSPDTEWQPPIK